MVGLEAGDDWPAEVLREYRSLQIRESRKYSLLFFLCCAGYCVVYLLWMGTGQIVPVVGGMVCLTFHFGALVSYCFRSLHLSQLAHVALLLLHSVTAAFCQPEVQFHMVTCGIDVYGGGIFGNKPACSFYHSHCWCRIKGAHYTTMLHQVTCMIFNLFILRFSMATAASVLCVTTYTTMVLCLGKSGFGKEAGFDAPEFICHAIGVLCSLAAKWVIERSQRSLFCELKQRSRQLVEERVLRCQAEFSQDRPRGDERHAGTSAKSSSVGASEEIFDGLEGEDATALDRMKALGRQEHWLLGTEDIQLCVQNILGAGGFGVVVVGRLHNSPVAVKVAKDPFVTMATDGVRDIANELRVLRHVRHPNIVGFHGACIDHQRLALVLEFVEGIALEEYCSRSGDGAAVAVAKPVRDTERVTVLLGICHALLYLHTRQPHIVHGDIKPDNIMVEEYAGRPRARLLDFGLSRVLTRRARQLGGTLRWMAPEVVRGGASPTSAADSYSFGLLIYFVITGLKPWANVPLGAISRNLEADRSPVLAWPEGPLAAGCRPVAERCIAPACEARPSMQEVHQGILQGTAQTGLQDAPLGAHPGAAACSPAPMDWPAAMQALEALFQEAWQEQHARSRARRPSRAAGRTGRLAVAPAPLPAVLEEDSAAPPGGGDPGGGTDGLLPTPLDTRKIVLEEVMARWHTAGAASSCCCFHAAVQDLRRTCKQLRAMPCSAEFLPLANAVQCPSCLQLVDLEEDPTDCDLCGESLPLSAGPGAPRPPGRPKVLHVL